MLLPPKFAPGAVRPGVTPKASSRTPAPAYSWGLRFYPHGDLSVARLSAIHFLRFRIRPVSLVARVSTGDTISPGGTTPVGATRGRGRGRGLTVTHSLADSNFRGHRPAVKMRKQNLWCQMSVHLGTLRSRSVHPASPVLLTKNGPLVALDPSARVQQSNGGLAPIRSSRVREGSYFPQTPNRCSTGCDSHRDCYPEGNFDRNQLPDGSISLSPLYVALTIDLHVRTAADFHRPFGRLLPSCV